MMRGIQHYEDFGWSNAPRGSGGGGQNTETVSQSVQIPQYEQQFSQENQDLARSLSANPYPAYNAPLVQGFSPQQQAGMQMAGQAAGAYQPDLNWAEAWTNNALQNGAPLVNAGQQALQGAMGTANSDAFYGAQSITNAGGYAQPNIASADRILSNSLGAAPNNSAVMASYMSPYVQQALAPQVMALQTQLGQQQNALNAQATQANAFGDARHGSAQALQNFYGNQALAGLEGQGYNTAFNNALQTALGEQQYQGQVGQNLANIGINTGNLALGMGQALGNLGTNLGQLQLAQGQALGQLGLNVGQQQMAGANQLANLGQMQQGLGIQGANALFNAGQQQQTLGQQELNQAYQQFLNQANWPYQMLNIRESALSNSPYNMVNATTVPQANMAAQGFGASLAGLGSIGSLLGSGGGGGSNNAPFGGSAYPSPH